MRNKLYAFIRDMEANIPNIMDRKVNIYITKHNINTGDRHVNGISKYLKQKQILRHALKI